MAIENAVAASILDPDTQKSFDRISLYFGIGCFLVIHIVAVAFVITKVRSFSTAWLLIFLDVWLEIQVFMRTARGPQKNSDDFIFGQKQCLKRKPFEILSVRNI